MEIATNHHNHNHDHHHYNLIRLQVSRHCPALDQLDVHGCRKVEAITNLTNVINAIDVILMIAIDFDLFSIMILYFR